MRRRNDKVVEAAHRNIDSSPLRGLDLHSIKAQERCLSPDIPVRKQKREAFACERLNGIRSPKYA